MRRSIRTLAVLILIALFSAGSAAAAGYDITTYELSSAQITQPITIVLLADMHDADHGDRLIEDIAARQPDLILLAGDMQNSSQTDTSELEAFCTRISALAPTFAIEGNHENLSKLSTATTSAMYARAGVRYLVNESETIRVGEDTVTLIGMRGISERSWKKHGGPETMAALPDRYTGLRICMAHIPYLFKCGLEYYEYDLAVAGHVEGGVLQLPGIGGLYSYEEGFLPEFSGGCYSLPNGAELIVSRGLGDSKDWQEALRALGNRPELVVITVEPGGTDTRRYCRIVNAEGRVNVRSAPTTGSDRLTTTAVGSEHVLLEPEKEGWYRVRVHGREGYISADYVQPIE